MLTLTFACAAGLVAFGIISGIISQSNRRSRWAAEEKLAVERREAAQREWCRKNGVKFTGTV